MCVRAFELFDAACHHPNLGLGNNQRISPSLSTRAYPLKYWVNSLRRTQTSEYTAMYVNHQCLEYEVNTDAPHGRQPATLS